MCRTGAAHLAHVRFRLPLFEFRRHHRPAAHILQLRQERKPVFTELLPLRSGRARQVEVVFAISNVSKKSRLLRAGLAGRRLRWCARTDLEVIVVFDVLVGKSFFLRNIKNGVYAACEVVRTRRRIVDIVGRTRVVEKIGAIISTARACARAFC